MAVQHGLRAYLLTRRVTGVDERGVILNLATTPSKNPGQATRGAPWMIRGGIANKYTTGLTAPSDIEPLRMGRVTI